MQSENGWRHGGRSNVPVRCPPHLGFRDDRVRCSTSLLNCYASDHQSLLRRGLWRGGGGGKLFLLGGPSPPPHKKNPFLSSSFKTIYKLGKRRIPLLALPPRSTT